MRRVTGTSPTVREGSDLWRNEPSLTVGLRPRRPQRNFAPLLFLSPGPEQDTLPISYSKNSLDPGTGSTLYNLWSDWHEFRKAFLSFRRIGRTGGRK